MKQGIAIVIGQGIAIGIGVLALNYTSDVLAIIIAVVVGRIAKIIEYAVLAKS